MSEDRSWDWEHRIIQLESREIALSKRVASLETHVRSLVDRVSELEKYNARCRYCEFPYEDDVGKTCYHCGRIIGIGERDE